MIKPAHYSHHAETVLTERRLEKSWIEQTINDPEWVEPDPSGEGAERRYRSLPDREDRYLRVICVETATEIRIISAFLDRGARRPT
jgi:hypothetical protein